MKSVEPAVSPSAPSGHGGRDVFAVSGDTKMGPLRRQHRFS
jgi:hypothetical protein